jgi:hypothetical protein
VLTNLAAGFFAEAREEADKKQKDKNRKYRCQVNVNHEIGVLGEGGKAVTSSASAAGLYLYDRH